MKASVIVITLNRPDCVRRCLDCLRAQSRLPDEVIVVDSSRDTITRDLVAQYPEVIYLRNETGFGRMTTSRNIALKIATGEIIAFIDDDAFAWPDWLENLLSTYTDDATIGAVGGRARNNAPGEDSHRVHDVGRLQPTGELTGFFAADTGKIIQVDHIMGCNMSFRRSVLAELGGFCEDYPGISGVCEDTDMSMRVGRIGYRLLFNPAAVVDHVGAPQAKGKRFDARYAFYAQRNHIVMLTRNFGLFSPLLARYAFYTAFRDTRWVLRQFWLFFKGMFDTLQIIAADALGWLSGIAAGVAALFGKRQSPRRTGPDAQAIRDALSETPVSSHATDRDPLAAPERRPLAGASHT